MRHDDNNDAPREITANDQGPDTKGNLCVRLKIGESVNVGTSTIQINDIRGRNVVLRISADKCVRIERVTVE